MTPRAEDLERSIVDGDREAAEALAAAFVRDGGEAIDAVAICTRGIRAVGDLWEEGEYFLPELVASAEAMQAAMRILDPHLRAARTEHRARGRVVIGTVAGDLHDIGKSLVATLLSAHGFHVVDLGSNVAVETFLSAARTEHADIVAASALLTTTMPAQRELAEAVRDAGLDARVLVGGAPATEEWARSIGAAYAENAMRAVQVAERLVAGIEG